MALSNLLEDNNGTPWIARLPWLWAFLISIVTAGAFPLTIGIYLSAWVWSKRSASRAIYAYGGIVVLATLAMLPIGIHFQASIMEDISTGGAIIWVAAGFLLRRDLQLHFIRPDGDLPRMSILWTTLFSVYYLNYCVWAESDAL